MNHLKIKNLSKEDRPREKLLKYGASSLTNAELLAIIIGSGTKHKSAIQLAQELLYQYNHNLNNIATQEPHNLKLKGLGITKCIQIIAALELSKRRYVENQLPDEILSSAEKASRYFMKYLSDSPHEYVYVALLNNQNKVLQCICISKGGLDHAPIDIREICKHALLHNSTRVIMAHNHPSGNVNPSPDDIKITNKVKKALDLINIQLLDHIIIHQNNYYSFAENHLLKDND